MKQASEPILTVQDYISSQPPEVQQVLFHLRSLILSAAPGAQECISYNMPAYKYKGPLVYFGAFKAHCSLFPGKKLNDDITKQLKGFEMSAGTIRFTSEHPIPDAVVTAIVIQRVRENDAKAALRKHAKKK